ncbi:MAG: hypothetical protein IJK73_08045 [Bacteroidales bacterium]|nr:hypothetical protein [Bacteroidales bacterium]
MKKSTNEIKTYDAPEVDVINLKMESIICESVCDGDNEGTGEECWEQDN